MFKGFPICLCLIGLTLVSTAQVETRYVYSESFGIDEGLKHTVIADLKSDQNDLVWIAVGGTLQLFDGDQFVDMSHLIHSANSNGSFGFENGKDVFLLKQHLLYKFTPAQYTSHDAPKFALPGYARRDAPPKIIYEDSDFLYICHANDSLYQIEKESLSLKKTYALPHQPNRNYRWSSIFISPEPVSIIHYLDTSYLHCSFELTTGKTTIDSTSGDAAWGAMASGDTLLILQTNTLDIVANGIKHSLTLPEPGRVFNGMNFLVAGRDSLYVSLRNGIYLFNLRSMTWISKIQRTAGASFYDIKVRSMLLDKTGHLYFSTFYTGLVKMYPPNEAFEYVGIEGRKKYFIKCIRVSEKNNLVLAGTLMDGLLIFDTNGVLKHQLLYNPDSTSFNLVSSILKISDSRYIILSNKTFDLTFRGDQYTLRELHDSERNRLTYYDYAVEDDLRQRYFIFNHRQLIEIRPDDPVPIVSIKQPLLGSSISATISGDSYVMSALDELIFFNQALTPRPMKFNVPDFGYSRCLVPYAPGQFLVATDLGLFLLDTLHPTTPYESIYDHMVYAVLPGHKKGEFWFSTDFGLYRLDADLRYKRYSIESGLQESEFNTNSCYKSASGKLYFGGVNGITAFYPEQIEKEEDKPLPFISVFSINGKVRERYIAPGDSPGFNLAHDENVIQLRLLAKGQKSPRRYNFQYMVKGLHEEWINLGRNMDIQLQLAPGRYTIYFHIADSFEPDAAAIHDLQLRIKPPIYKRWWSIATLLLLSFYVLYYFMNLRRKRQAMRQAYALELEKKLHEERIRISRDLHDNIGAQMATVKRGINFIIDHSDRLTSEQTQHKMKDLETISTQINQELRDTIWAVQNEQIDVAGFITRLKNYVFQLLGPDSPYRVFYEEHGEMHFVLSPYIALNLHRICQEAFNNILKHADATAIRIIVESRQHELKISISDNGKGFDPDRISEGYGLGNIRKRAEQIGAQVSFNTLNHEGSSLEIKMNPFTPITDKKIKDGKD
jgi:signal transduction histidine kinase